MYQLSDAQKALFQGFSRQVCKIVRGGSPTLTITESDIEELTIDRYVDAKTDKLEIGNAIANQVTFTVRNTSGTYSATDFLGKEFQVSVGTADWSASSPTPFYVPMGFYEIDDVQVNGRRLVVTGLDRMTKFDKRWDGANISSFPVTVGQLVTAIATVCDVPFTTPSPTPLNWNYNVELVYGDDITYRTVLQWCAFLMGKSAYIGRDGHLYFGWHNKTISTSAGYRYDTTTANRFSGTISDNQFRMCGILYQNNANATTLYDTGDFGDEYDYYLEYAGCGILNDTDAPTVIPAILNEVKWFKHYSSSEVTLPAPWVDPFDDTTYTPSGGSRLRTVCTHAVYRMNANMSFSGDGMLKTAVTKPTTRSTQVAIQQASQEASKYITTISGRDGVCVHNADDYENYLNLNGTTLDVYVDNGKRASYGAEVIIGSDGDSHVTVTDDGLDVYTRGGATYPVTVYRSLHLGNDSTNSDPTPTPGLPAAPCFAYGSLTNSLPTMGRYSASFNGQASGNNSFAVGGTASGASAVSLGGTASGESAISLGGTASGSHAISLGGTASGDYSVATSLATASSRRQVAIGEYNVIDSSGTYAFIIGNGTSAAGPSGTTITRSNAFTVDWNGNVTAGGKFVTTHTGVGSNAGVVVSGSTNADVAVGVQRTDTNYGVELCVGASGVNRGVYDRGTAGSVGWMIYMDSSNHVIVPNLYIGSDQVKPLKYYDETSAKNYTISSSNYVSVTRPSAISGKTIVSISVLAWTSNSGAFWVMPYTASNSGNFYIVGNSGTTINGLKLRYWYQD